MKIPIKIAFFFYYFPFQLKDYAYGITIAARVRAFAHALTPSCTFFQLLNQLIDSHGPFLYESYAIGFQTNLVLLISCYQ
jgi:hypothetical protein